MNRSAVCLAVGMCLALSSQVWSQGPGNAELAAEARTILKSACHRCHGDDGTVEGGLSYVMDRQQLVSRKQVFPRDSANSRLIRRIQMGEMPPPDGDSAALTKQQIETLVKWVDAGAPDFNKAPPPRKFLAATTMIQLMHDDLQKRSATDRPFTRYLTLTHLYNAGRSEDELRSYYHGITKLVNSLSWGRKVVTPTLIGSPPTILRIDIRDYKWSAAVWDKLASADPYGMHYPTNPVAKKLYEDSGCPLPYARGDWFVAAAARPPLYHEILQLPMTERELEALLHVDVEENLRSLQVARAGFNGSAVSRNNRLIERHDSSYGYYWKSYDFAKNVERQNLFSHPLGPGPSANYFKHDGGELIFSLPNGFQGYLLVDGEGRRIDKGPTEIVSDPKQPDRAVENGLSCMSCHVRGMLPKDDQIRLHVEKNPGAFAKKELESVLALYPKQATFQRLIEDDAEKFRKATEAAGMPPAMSEPIMALARLFESELDLPLAAAEASLQPDEFQSLLTKSPALARELGSLVTSGGTVQRQTFTSSFAALARAAKVGTPRTRPADVAAVQPSAGKAVASVDPPLVKGTRWIQLGGRNKFPELFQPNKEAVTDKTGLNLNGRNYLLSKKGDYLTRDFKFELVYTFKADASAKNIMFVGLGEADRNTAYNEPKNSVFLKIHPPGVDSGSVVLANAPTSGLNSVGRISKAGPHRAIIEKIGDVLTLSIDVDNDGPSDDDLEKTIPDLKVVGPFLHKKNTHIFFGGGATFQQLRLGAPEKTAEEE